jgi:dTMP kinase
MLGLPHVIGKFISIEGPDGAGKSTLAGGLRDELMRREIDCVLTREPGDGPIGPQIRSVLLDGVGMDSWTEVFLFLADRRQHGEGLIRPALEEGQWVICDRYVDSTVVYQGYGRDLDVGLLKKLNKIATAGLMPDRTLLIDLDAEAALARISGDRATNRLDREPMEFHRRVREGFLAEARLDPARFAVVDGRLPPTEVLAQALAALES